MKFPRLHLFEFNDTPGVPSFVKDTVIESLSRTLAWGHVLRGLIAPFGRFLEETGATEVLDVGAGAGGPAAVFVAELLAAGVRPPRFILTDLRPQVEAWRALRDRYPEYIDFVEEPVDATRLPPDLVRGRATAIINALHHLPPALARDVLVSSAERSRGVFVVEGFERTPAGFASFIGAGLPALLVNPLLSPRERAKKAVFTYLTPMAVAISVWDGLVSTMRVYSEEELREMVAPLRELDFVYGTYPIGWFGHGYYFTGRRR